MDKFRENSRWDPLGEALMRRLEGKGHAHENPVLCPNRKTSDVKWAYSAGNPFSNTILDRHL